MEGPDGELSDGIIFCSDGAHQFHPWCIKDNVYKKEITIEAYEYILDQLIESGHVSALDNGSVNDIPKFTEGMTINDMGSLVKDAISGGLNLPSEVCPFCSFEEMAFEDAYEFMLFTMGGDLESIRKMAKALYRNSRGLYRKIEEVKCSNEKNI